MQALDERTALRGQGTEHQPPVLGRLLPLHHAVLHQAVHDAAHRGQAHPERAGELAHRGPALGVEQEEHLELRHGEVDLEPLPGGTQEAAQPSLQIEHLLDQCLMLVSHRARLQPPTPRRYFGQFDYFVWSKLYPLRRQMSMGVRAATLMAAWRSRAGAGILYNGAAPLEREAHLPRVAKPRWRIAVPGVRGLHGAPLRVPRARLARRGLCPAREP